VSDIDDIIENSTILAKKINTVFQREIVEAEGDNKESFIIITGFMKFLCAYIATKSPPQNFRNIKNTIIEMFSAELDIIERKIKERSSN